MYSYVRRRGACGSHVTTGVSLVVYVTGKDLAKKKKITMVKPFAGSSGMDIFDIAAPPRQTLRDGLAEDPYEGFYSIT